MAFFQITQIFYCLFGQLKKIFVSLPLTKPALWGMAGHNIDGIQRPTKPFVGLAEGKGRFRTLLLVYSNFATLNPHTEVMQLKRLRGCIISRHFIFCNLLLQFLDCIV